MFKGINWIAVVVAVVLLEVLGFVWYGPLFGKAWMAVAPVQPDPAKVNLFMSLGVINTLIVVVGLAWLTGQLHATSLKCALGVSLAAWFFFDFTTQALEYLYMGLDRTLVAVNMGYQLASYLITGLVLALVKIRLGAKA